jgi:hypothetical protein
MEMTGKEYIDNIIEQLEKNRDTFYAEGISLILERDYNNKRSAVTYGPFETVCGMAISSLADVYRSAVAQKIVPDRPESFADLVRETVLIAIKEG